MFSARGEPANSQPLATQAGLANADPLAQAKIRRRAARATGFGRFLGVSLAVHATVLIAGISGGAAYMRRAGELAKPAAIMFASAEPLTTNSIVTPESEPERTLKREEMPTESEAMLDDAEPIGELAATPASELLSSSASPQAWPDESNLERVIGDPLASWHLPNHERAGLQFGLEMKPPVSDCCGEPQPSPATPVALDVYIYPEVIRMARAEFPEKSQRLGEQGSVLLEMQVGADGLVKGVRVIEGSGHLRLDDCAETAGWDWSFKPATRNGVAVASIARHRYSFRFSSSGG